MFLVLRIVGLETIRPLPEHGESNKILSKLFFFLIFAHLDLDILSHVSYL